MAEFGGVSRLIAELQERIEALAGEIGRLTDAEPAARSRRKQGKRSAPTVVDRPTDVPKLIPPTRTDDPDSIVGGRPTSRFPDCCAVGSLDRYFCTGTLIAPNLVVTAGHCGDDIARVFLRGSDIDLPDEGETLRVTGNHEHPTVDLRVLVLEKDSKAAPRHIAQGFEVQGDVCTLAGFGTIDFDGTFGYGVKREVDVPITSLGCEGDAPTKFGCVAGAETVAGHRGLGLDSCHGDSGGPLYIQGALGDEYLLGATSRGTTDAGTACGDGGIYVRVDQVVGWITETTGVPIEGPRL